MEFDFKKNVKLVIPFEIGETVFIDGAGTSLHGYYTIKDFKTHFGGCESGILVKLNQYNEWIDVGWLIKINT